MSDAIGMLAVALAIASVGGCIVGTRYVDNQKTPQQLCVERAWTNADRVECLKAK